MAKDKNNKHPESHPVCFVDVSSGEEFLTVSTMTSKQTKEINGVKYYVVPRDITSSSHPVYTGKQRFVDTAGRVEKFQSKFRRQRRG